MKNFIFKSEADFHKISFNKFDLILTELRHQRIDLANINRQVVRIYNALALQKQVDGFFEEKPHPEDREDED